MMSLTMDDHEDQPTNSIKEVDSQEQYAGPGVRSYECIFCKHGFTTAQALGGHMNIHRKDRAKSRSNYLNHNRNSSKQEDYSCYSGPRFYQPSFTSYPRTYFSGSPNSQEGQVHYTSYFASTSSTPLEVNHEYNHHQDVHGVITSPSREEKMMSLSLQFGWVDGEDREMKRSIRGGSKGELDLELRLGHDP